MQERCDKPALSYIPLACNAEFVRPFIGDQHFAFAEVKVGLALFFGASRLDPSLARGAAWASTRGEKHAYGDGYPGRHGRLREVLQKP
jgi:hypothetical protein